MIYFREMLTSVFKTLYKQAKVSSNFCIENCVIITFICI